MYLGNIPKNAYIILLGQDWVNMLRALIYSLNMYAHVHYLYFLPLNRVKFPQVRITWWFLKHCCRSSSAVHGCLQILEGFTFPGATPCENVYKFWESDLKRISPLSWNLGPKSGLSRVYFVDFYFYYRIFFLSSACLELQDPFILLKLLYSWGLYLLSQNVMALSFIDTS